MNNYNTVKAGRQHVSVPNKALYHLLKMLLQLSPDKLSAITPNQPDTYSSIADEIATYINKTNPKEIWIEWNGMVSFHELETLLYSDKLRHMLQIEKVLYICTDQFVASMLPGFR